MGKTKNRKRAKILRQRKKERENKEFSKPDNSVVSKIKKRLDKELNANVKFSYRKKTQGRKISDVVSKMIKPLLDEAETFEEKQNVIGLGVMAWNLGVIKVNNGEKELKKELKVLGKKIPKDIIKVLLEYSEVKCEKYSEYNELIIDYELTKRNSHQNNLTVTYKMVNE